MKAAYFVFQGIHSHHLEDLYEHLLCCVPNVVGGKVQLRLVNHNKKKDEENDKKDKDKQRQKGVYYIRPEVIHLMVNRLVKQLRNEAHGRLQLKQGQNAPLRLDSQSSTFSDCSGDGRKWGLSDEMLTMRVCDPAMGTGHFVCHFLV